MLLVKESLSILFCISIFFEFSIFFHLDLYGYQIKIARITQFLLVVYLIFILIFKIYKKDILLKKNIFISDLDIFFFIFIIYLFFNSLFRLELLSSSLTVFIEIIKYIFYYIFYVYLTRLFNNKLNLFFIYKFLYYFLYFVIIFGLLEFVINIFLSQNFIPRQLNYGFRDEYIGLRFHSILGEPRDAASTLIILISIILIFELFLYEKIKSIYLLAITFICSLLTFSTTLLFCFSLIFIFFLIYNKNFKISFLVFIIFLFLSLFLFLLSSKVEGYFTDLFLLPFFIDSHLAIKDLNIEPQLINIMPIFLFLKELFSLHIYEFLFGYGLDASSHILYEGYQNIGDKPHSQLSRLLYDLGITGLFAYIFILNFYMKTFLKFYSKNKLLILLSFIIFLSASLAHRTGSFFILIMITQLIYLNKINDNKN